MVEILLVLVLWPIFLMLSFGVIELVAWQFGAGGFVDRGFAEPMDMDQVEVCTAMLVMLAAGLPASMLAARIVRRRRWKSIFGVTGSFDWKLFLTGVCVVLPLTLLSVSAMYLAGPSRSVSVNVPLLLACIALVPAQSMAEEIVFRGVLGQACGKWTRSWIAAVVIPLPLFVVGHEYSWTGLFAIAWFALCAGYLVHRTGGLAAPMALHVGNNLGFFIFGAVGLSDLNQSQISSVQAVIDAVFCIIATAVLLYMNRAFQNGSAEKRGVGSLTTGNEEPINNHGEKMPKHMENVDLFRLRFD